MKLHMKLIYATDDDKKNCTFTPLIKKSKSLETNQNADAKSSSFVDRQDKTEKDKRKTIDESIGKANYDAKIDKKRCPHCGAQQKYDEIKEKKKNCPSCNVEYVSKVVWGTVEKEFMEKNMIAVEKSKALRHNPEVRCIHIGNL